ncbi:MAG: outer membrane protein assembly factor BamD [Planctomycetota bacterium]
MNRLQRVWILAAAAMLACPAAPLAADGERIWDPQANQWVAAPEPKEGTPAGELAIVRQGLRNGRPKAAIKAADSFLSRYPTDPQREQVLLLAGQAEMQQGDYLDAYDYFEQQIAEFPGGRDFEQALNREYEIGNAFVSGRKRKTLWIIPVGAEERGLEILTRIAEHAPGSEIAQKALMRIGDYHYAQGQWPQAVDAYDNFVRLFGQTDAAAQARLNAARATFAQFISVQHDDTPLLEARQRFRSFAEAYPERAQQVNISGVLAQIADARAEKTFRIAEFYRRTDRPQAAEYYFRLVRKEFPETRWARQAAVQLGQEAE